MTEFNLSSPRWGIYRRFIRPIRFLWQRLTRGWDDSDTWNLDWEFSEWIAPRLKRLRELSNSYPPDLTEQEWDEILAKMIYGFSCAHTLDDHDHKAADHAMELYAKYWRYLGW